MPGVDDFVTILSKSSAEISGASHNAYLRSLVAQVNQCVAILKTNGTDITAKIDALDDIMVKAAFWLTSKKPRLAPKRGKSSTKNPARWNAMTKLAERVAEESSKLGVKLLHSPTDFRQIKGAPQFGKQSYWLERIDRYHRPGFQLSQHYETWLGTPSDDTFWEYVDTQMPPSSSGTLKVKFIDHTRPSGLNLLNTYQVTKNDGDGKVYIHSGVDLFDTEFNSTAASGQGFAIFVCDSGAMYSSSHVIGEFHHSTFFAGMPVTAAGEVVAKDGDIKLITAKSGHYRPSSADMQRMVQQLSWIPGTALIIPDFSSTGKHTKCYRVRDFRSAGVASFPVTKKLFLQRMPDFLKGGNQAYQNILNRLPETDVGVWGTRA